MVETYIYLYVQQLLLQLRSYLKILFYLKWNTTDVVPLSPNQYMTLLCYVQISKLKMEKIVLNTNKTNFSP